MGDQMGDGRIPGDDVIVFDLPLALRVTGDDREILIEIIGVFLEDLPHMMGEMKKALERDDAGSLELHAHSLKGASANVGGQRVRALAFAIEKAGRAKQLEEAKGLFPALETEVERFGAHLRGLDLTAL